MASTCLLAKSIRRGKCMAFKCWAVEPWVSCWAFRRKTPCSRPSWFLLHLRMASLLTSRSTSITFMNERLCGGIQTMSTPTLNFVIFCTDFSDHLDPFRNFWQATLSPSPTRRVCGSRFPHRSLRPWPETLTSQGRYPPERSRFEVHVAHV